MKKLIMLLTAFVLLIGGIYLATLQANDQPARLVTVTASELKDKITKGDNFSVYVYSDTCTYCKEFAPILENYLEENNIKIYRVATTSAAEHDSVRELLGDKFQGTPSVFSFKAGAVEDYMVGAQTKEALATYAQKNKTIFTI